MLQTVGSEGAGGKQISFAVATMQFLKLSVHILSFMVGACCYTFFHRRTDFSKN